MHEEIELKLSLPSAEVKKLRRLPLLKSLKTGRTARCKFVSTYFDTPEFALRQAGMALRVRDVGGGRNVQTLKAPVPGAVKTGLQHYAEYEADVAETRPEIGKLDDPQLRRWIEQRDLPRQFGPVFTTRIMRTTMPLRLGDSDIELAIDEGSIEASGQKVQLREIELELKSGRPTQLYELALRLMEEDVDFRLERRTKSARGYALHEPPDDAPVKAAPLELPAGCSVRDAFGIIAHNCYDQMRSNEAAVLLGVDAEGVHQMRVAVRRLRALLSLFKSVLASDVLDRLKGELRWLQQQLGPPRDWDVFLADTLAPKAAQLSRKDEFDRVRRTAEALREAAYVRARTDVGSGRYAGLLLRLQLYLADDRWFRDPAPGEGAFLDQPVKDLAASLLKKRAERLDRFGRRHKTLTETQLHEFRIECKKMRYAVDFFRSLYPKSRSRAYRAGLVGIQDSLGTINDSVVARRLLNELTAAMKKGGGKGPGSPLPGSSPLLDWHAQRIAGQLKNLDAIWKRHARHKLFWR